MHNFKNDENRDLMSNFITPLKLKQISFQINQKDKLTSQIQKIVSSSFNEYFQHCSNYDEYRPKTNECLNQFGFSATIFESLEVLHILGLTKEFQKAKNYIMKNLSPSQIQWVNRREFWSRCIGSLLGTYILTSDSFFLSKATEFSSSLLQASLTSPFVNIANKKARNIEWINGVSLTDIVSGLPELFTLSKLTNNESFSLTYLTILNNIPTFSNNSIYNFYELENKKPIVDFTAIDGNIIDFYHILSIAHSIKPMRSLKEVLTNFLNYIKLTEKQSCVYGRYSSLFDAISITEKDEINVGNNEKLSNYQENLKNLVENSNDYFELNCSSFYYLPFRFDASFLRAFLRNANKNDEKDENADKKVLNFIFNSFNACKLKNGFSGLLKTNTHEIVDTNTQHSNFFGQWVSLASYLLSNHKNISKNGVFNERGHLLYSSEIFPDEEDE